MDYAMGFRKKLIESSSSPITHQANTDAMIKRYADSLAAKRITAINTLGQNWTMHPNYCAADNPQHNPMQKFSSVLTAFLHQNGAIEAGRV